MKAIQPALPPQAACQSGNQPSLSQQLLGQAISSPWGSSAFLKALQQPAANQSVSSNSILPAHAVSSQPASFLPYKQLLKPN